MSSALSVSWEVLDEAAGVCKEFYFKWRPKVEKRKELGSLERVHRRVVIKVTEEAKARASFN